MGSSPPVNNPPRKPPFHVAYEAETWEEFLRLLVLLEHGEPLHFGPLNLDKPPPPSIVGWWST